MDVCVIGCGPSGVSAAIYLKMAGYDVEIFPLFYLLVLHQSKLHLGQNA